MNFGEPECTSKCRSLEHGRKIVSALTKNNEIEVLSYMRQMCCNLVHVSDEFGRNALHMAASCGRNKILEWLLEHNHSDRSAKDGESGWTPLHRSLFYGQLSAAMLLIMHGSNLHVQDNDGYTPLDLIMKDRLPYVEYSTVGPCEVYVWGSNTNFNLGHESQQSKASPEVVESFKREKISIKQVVMCKYHTIFLSHDGKPFTCGHGHGGRLGHNSEQTCITPKPVKILDEETCIQVAGGADHSVFLTSSGTVLTCGLNSYHQLGLTPPPEHQLTPRAIKFFQQKNINIIGICAAKFHTVAFSKDAVYTFGLNAGQLGHLKTDKADPSPRKVSALNLRDVEIVSATASDGATVCVTNKGDIYVLHEFQCRKIASKQMDIANVSAIGGQLDAKCYPLVLKEKGGIELKIMLLTNSGKLYLWSESHPQLCRCLFSLRRQLYIKHFAFNQNSVILISDGGEGFLGFLMQKKTANPSNNIESHRREKRGKDLHTESFIGENDFSQRGHKNSVSSGLFDFLDKDECHTIKVDRLPHIHRGIAAACDPVGKNLAVLQGHPSNSVLENPSIEISEINEHFAALLEEADIFDKLHDLTLQVAGQQFPVHKYILVSRAEYFKKFLREQNEKDGIVKIDNIHPENFKQILKYIYSQTCDFLKVGYKLIPIASNDKINSECSDSFQKNDFEYNAYNGKSAYSVISNNQTKKNVTKNNHSNKNQDVNPLKSLQEMAKKMGIKSLEQQLESVKHSNNKIIYVPNISRKQMKFERNKYPELYDLIIESEDGIELPCHKCVLVARSEYFHSMFGNPWIETTSNRSIHIPVNADVLEIVLDYLYTDDALKLDRGVDDTDFVCRILVIADQLLLNRLKSKCEKVLATMITLKNAAELLQFSFTYQADQLQNVCMEFISLNLMPILETKSLSLVSDEAMQALSKKYREMILSMQYRCITPYITEPSNEEIKSVAAQYPLAFDEIVSSNLDSNKLDNSGRKSKQKKRYRIRKPSGNEAKLSDIDKNESHLSITSDHLSDFEDVLSSPSPDKLDDMLGSPREFEKCPSSPIPIPPSDSKCMSQTTVGSISPISSELQSLPWHNQKMSPDNLDLRTIMMQQQNEMKSFLQANLKSISIHKKPQKLSQKQRKRLSSASSCTTEHDLISPATSPKATSISPPTAKPWGEISGIAQPLKDIMKAERSAVQSKHINNLSPSPRQLAMQDISPPSTTSFNPWTKESSVKNSSEQFESFSDILLEEQKRKQVVPVKTKSLDLIQIEDAAIEELLKFYNASGNPDEHVTVLRILPHSLGTPQWKGRDNKSHC